MSSQQRCQPVPVFVIVKNTFRTGATGPRER